MTVMIVFERLHEGIRCPEKATSGSAGFDVRVVHSTSVNPGETALIPLGFKVRVPEGYELQVRPRSSLAALGLIIPNAPGTIDSDYRGEVKVLVHNIGVDTISLPMDFRIAQLVVSEVPRGVFIEGTVGDTTARGGGGFGSTGRF